MTAVVMLLENFAETLLSVLPGLMSSGVGISIPIYKQMFKAIS